MDNSKQRYKELGDFLKTRRAKILPSQVGLPEGTRRRTPGLRREEVASLAGVGLTWYTWIEQGRQIQVSAQVLQSLAKALRLDKQETMHLFTLAQLALPAADEPNYHETVTPMLQHVLDRLQFSPALIMDARWNVIAWNTAALVLSDYGKINVCKRNAIWIMFTDEEIKKAYTDWESAAKAMIARFRIAYGKFVGDPWMEEFIADLKNESREFALLWAIHDVEVEEERLKTIIHPALGLLKFEHTTLLVSENHNFTMSVFIPLDGSDTEEKVKQFLSNHTT